MSYTDELYRPVYDALAVPATVVLSAVELETTADWDVDGVAVTGMAANTGLVVGQSYDISGVGLPVGTTLVYGPSVNTGTLSQAATADGVDEDIAITVSPPVSHTGIPVIDKTEGYQEGGTVDVATIQPAATVLAQDLVAKELTIDAIQGMDITFNGQTWRISSSRPKPSPGGELDGEYLLFLEA